MKFLSSWLKKLLGAKESTKEEAKKPASNLGNIVVGKILEIEKHPNADRLKIVMVQTRHASSVQKLQIVCGAANIAVGQKVPIALVGAKLPSGLEIKEAEIRGVKSFGMLCSEDELGLGTDHSGIMILDEKAEIGMGFSEHINLNK
jgi:phenylalanyl-tRNA synthetase beta chain